MQADLFVRVLFVLWAPATGIFGTLLKRLCISVHRCVCVCVCVCVCREREAFRTLGWALGLS